MLGKGSFGKVFLANDPVLDRSVAIKVPTSKRVELGGGAEEFVTEARAVARLDHPNIVPVYDCGITEDGRCYVVSKYVRGKELRNEIRKGVSHQEASSMIAMLARALHVAHVAGVVHRDVKPSNVIVDAKRRPHLLDFGLAHSERDQTNSEILVGTPAYMSPEQAAGGSHRIDGRSDVYSLAVIFYEMLTGHRPCKSDKIDEVLDHLKLGEVRPPRQSDDSIPVELERICLKALSRTLSERYNTAKDLAADLESWLVESGAEDLLGLQDETLDSGRGSRSGKKRAEEERETSSILQSPAASVAVIGSVALLSVAALFAFGNP